MSKYNDVVNASMVLNELLNSSDHCRFVDDDVKSLVFKNLTSISDVIQKLESHDTDGMLVVDTMMYMFRLALELKDELGVHNANISLKETGLTTKQTLCCNQDKLETVLYKFLKCVINKNLDELTLECREDGDPYVYNFILHARYKNNGKLRLQDFNIDKQQLTEARDLFGDTFASDSNFFHDTRGVTIELKLNVLMLTDENVPTLSMAMVDKLNVPDTADILLVDDDSIIRTILTKRLKSTMSNKYGFTPSIEQVSSGEDLLERVTAGDTFAMIILDMYFTGKKYDGKDLYNELKRIGYTHPIVILTGASDPRVYTNLKDIGVSHVFRKGSANLYCKLVDTAKSFIRKPNLLNKKV